MDKQNTISIPKIFQSDLTGAPMTHCISCEKELIASQSDYVIEKAIKPHQGYKSYNTVFEYAMCLPCAEKLRVKISKQSMQAMNQYFVENMNFAGRPQLDLESESVSIDPWLEKCLVKGTYAEEIGECQIYAQCRGGELIIREFPYMVSGEAIDELMQVMSAETLDEFDRLKDELIGPSEFQDLLKGGPRVFI
ncbi:MAG: hypothetical protein JXR07_17015 [Reichenbachiella sp.]